MSLSPHELAKRESKKNKKTSNAWETPPPGSRPVRKHDEEDDGPYEWGRAYWRPKPDLGQGKASLTLGPISVKAGGKGVPGVLAIGFLGAIAMVGVSAYCGLPTAAVVSLGLAPMVIASVLILLFRQ